ncbi:10884_t:CDS:2, partial [Dentiscutata heterogama]
VVVVAGVIVTRSFVWNQCHHRYWSRCLIRHLGVTYSVLVLSVLAGEAVC